VPFVLGAVEPNNSKNKKWSLGALCSEWRAFGHILISLLVDKCDLSTELCEAFSTGIVKGAIESIHLIQSENSDVNHADDTEMESSSSMQAVLDVSADAILAMFSLVVNNRAREEDKEDDGIQRFLPLIKSKGSKTIGCNLSYTSYRALMKLPFLSSTLGYLLEVKNIDIEYLVGSIVAMSISIGNSAKGLGRDHEYIMAVLSEMVSAKEKIKTKRFQKYMLIISVLVRGTFAQTNLGWNRGVISYVDCCIYCGPSGRFTGQFVDL
jgi:hypothetical protein